MHFIQNFNFVLPIHERVRGSCRDRAPDPCKSELLEEPGVRSGKFRHAVGKESPSQPVRDVNRQGLTPFSLSPFAVYLSLAYPSQSGCTPLSLTEIFGKRLSAYSNREKKRKNWIASTRSALCAMRSIASSGVRVWEGQSSIIISN